MPLLSDRTRLEQVKQKAWSGTKEFVKKYCYHTAAQDKLSEETLNGVKHPKLPTPPDVELENNIGSPLISYLKAEINVNSPASDTSSSEEDQ